MAALSLSKLVQLVGDEVIECHPMGQCITNVRIGTNGKDRGWTELTLKVWTQKLRPEDFMNDDQPYRGMVILMPTARIEAALEQHRNEKPAGE